MLKNGYTLFATRANGSVFRKQAKSVAQFVRMCVADEKAGGYCPPRKTWRLYEPDYAWLEDRKAWIDRFGNLRRTLPPGF